MTDGVVPISADERKARIGKAQRLMRQSKIDAIYIEPGASMFYFTGMRWGLRKNTSLTNTAGDSSKQASCRWRFTSREWAA